MRKRLFLLSLLVVFSFAIFRISTKVLAEQSGSSGIVIVRYLDP